MKAKFEMWHGAKMLGAITVIDGVVEEDSRAKGLGLDLTEWDRTAAGLGMIASTALGEPITILTPWEDE